MAFDHDELQGAIWDRVTAAVPDVPVFSIVPQDQPYPYARIDIGRVGDAGTKDVDFADARFQVSVFTRDVSNTQALSAAMKAIRGALHNRPAELVMTGQTAIVLRYVDQQVMQRDEGDSGIYLHGLLRFTAFIQEL